MNIENLYNSSIGRTTRLDHFKEIGNTVSEDQNSAFSSVLQTAMNQFNEFQGASETAIQSLVMDDGAQLHDIMIQTTEAQLSLELAVQVRNKCLEAFNEIKNMQF